MATRSIKIQVRLRSNGTKLSSVIFELESFKLKIRSEIGCFVLEVDAVLSFRLCYYHYDDSCERRRDESTECFGGWWNGLSNGRRVQQPMYEQYVFNNYHCESINRVNQELGIM